jgi:hypothetical protein
MPATLATNMVPNASQHSNRAASVVVVTVVVVVVDTVVDVIDVVVAVVVLTVVEVVVSVVEVDESSEHPTNVLSCNRSIALFKYPAALQSPESSLMRPEPLHPKTSVALLTPRVISTTALFSDETAPKHMLGAVWMTKSVSDAAVLHSKTMASSESGEHLLVNCCNRQAIVSQRRAPGCDKYTSPKMAVHSSVPAVGVVVVTLVVVVCSSASPKQKKGGGA